MSVALRVVEVSLDETLKLLRAELKREFPFTKFKVTRFWWNNPTRATDSAYVSVQWEDGPMTEEVTAICDGYAGTRYDCAEDVERPVRHLAADGTGAPLQVRYGTRGILCSRSLSLAAQAMYLRLVLELDTESPLFGPYTRVELVALPDEELVRVTGTMRVGGERLHGLAWRLSEARP